jgi:hypothetical protein
MGRIELPSECRANARVRGVEDQSLPTSLPAFNGLGGLALHACKITTSLASRSAEDFPPFAHISEY